MGLKESGSAEDAEVIDRGEDGVGWLAHPDERLQRASHALAVDGDVYLVDPLDIPDLDDHLAEYGEVAGVVLLLDRHGRDAAGLARRYDVPVYLPAWVDRDLPADVEVVREDRRLADTDYELREVVSVPGWHEAMLFDGETLVVPEAVGAHFTAAGERLGVHPFLRLTPPSALRGLRPARIRVGHGRGVAEHAPAVLEAALDGSRRNAPSALLNIIRGR